MHTNYWFQVDSMTGLLWVHCLGAHHNYQWPDQVIGIRRGAGSGGNSHSLRQRLYPQTQPNQVLVVDAHIVASDRWSIYNIKEAEMLETYTEP